MASKTVKGINKNGEVRIPTKQTITIKGYAEGHASATSADSCTIKVVDETGNVLVQKTATGISRLFSPESVKKTFNVKKQVAPGKIFIAISSTNELSPGKVTIVYDNSKPSDPGGSDVNDQENENYDNEQGSDYGSGGNSENEENILPEVIPISIPVPKSQVNNYRWGLGLFIILIIIIAFKR